ncbi:MAG TPA: hypothetical protein VHX40_01335 [Acidimicrobiales bacterium]|nr:hypothetical protein [Acidimicrobiales bacterium]
MTATTLSSGTDDLPGDGSSGGGAAGRDAAAEPLRPTWRPRRRGMARWAPIVATLLVIVGVIAVTLWQLHLNLLLSDTSTTGGDTGAHYMMPAYFTSDLFPHLTGWDPAWYDGYPIYTFYFVLPDALVALASHVITYNVAFKLATVLGSVLLPIAAWACGKLFRLRPPIPAALAAVTLPFLFDYTYTIYGGNLFSTLAGEYAYSFSIALAVLFVGLMARGLRTGRGRGWAAVVLALCIVSHIVPAMLALVGAGLLTAFELLPERLRLHDDAMRPSSMVSRAPGREGVRGRWPAVWWGVSTTTIGVLLSGWWLVPFGIRQPYSTSMGYANVTTYATLLFPHADLWALVLAGLAVLVAVLRRSRFGLLFGLLGGLSAIALIADPQASLYNVRFLPLWFLCVYLMAGWVFGVGVAAAARWWRRARLARWVWAVRSSTDPAATEPLAIGPPPTDLAAGDATAAGDGVAYGWWRRPPSARWAPGAVGGALLALFGALVVVVPPFIPAVASALPDLGITPGANEVKNWAQWNYTGYEGKADYPEYRAVVELMAKVGRQYGCGRAMWEYNADENRFGTPEALMLLPYWTNGCVDSMEGLLFESSTTTPFHFLNQAELSPDPSEPMVGLPYGSLDIPLGIQHLQMLGVKYFMAASTEVEQAANTDPSLRLVASTGPWKTVFTGQSLSTTWDVYEVRDAALVTPLTNEPAVLQGVGPRQGTWLGRVGPDGEPMAGPSLAWYDDPARWGVALTAGGLASWPRVTAATAGAAPAVAVPKTTVTDITTTDSSISFHVSRVGVPVTVKTSFFPNWQATGAKGPWRSAPNLMVVVPTSHDVTLTYGTTNANWLGDASTVVGVVALVGLAVAPVLVARRRRGTHRRGAHRRAPRHHRAPG